MKSNYSFVNVFQGSDKIALPKPEGIASKWLFIKAQCGNTTPAAAYPFGKMSLCAYTGAYPTGYGNLVPNSCGDPQSFDAKVHGFSHMHVNEIAKYINDAEGFELIGIAKAPSDTKDVPPLRYTPLWNFENVKNNYCQNAYEDYRVMLEELSPDYAFILSENRQLCLSG